MPSVEFSIIGEVKELEKMFGFINYVFDERMNNTTLNGHPNTNYDYNKKLL